MTSGNPDSNPLASGKPTGKAKSAQATSHSVKFAATPADQNLLQAVQQAMADRNLSFSDLSKLALTELLQGKPTLPMALLEQQIMTLQLQIMQLEQRSAISPADSDLRQQVQELAARVTQLEQQAISETPGSETETPEVDPILSRLAPLLEDF